MSYAPYISNARSRATRTKVTLSFSEADAVLLPKLLAREEVRHLAERTKDYGFAPSWLPKLTLSAALYRLVMREARSTSTSGQPASSGKRASPATRSSTRSKRKGARRHA